MKRDFTSGGLAGLLIGACVYAGASVLSTRLPILLPTPLFAAIAFVFFLLLSVIEIPIMLLGLRQLARSSSTPRRLLVGTFAFFVMFASVYASIFVMLTGQIAWGIALAALCLVRFASGMWIR